jgi:hypothetical protein
MAAKTSFSNVNTNIFSRKFGGTNVGVADPYVTGYHFIYFDKLPSQLVTWLNSYGGLSGSGMDDTTVKNVLAASCLSVTPPGGTLNKVEYTGLGGVKWAVPGNIDYGNTVSVKFFEFSKTPILDIIHGWVKMIRDYRTGASDLEDTTTGAGYTKSTYAALMYYWTTAPDGKTVEYYACYDGVFPAKDPQDLFTSDVETVGRLDVEIEFNVDYAWHESWVYDKCQAFADGIFASSKTAVEGYGTTVGTGTG